MAIDYFELPGLLDRIAISDAIVIGSFGRLIGSEPDSTEGVRRVRGLFEFEVHEWIKGESVTNLAIVRQVGELTDEHIRWLVPVYPRRVLLLLARDVQLGLPDNTFAPISSSAFDIDDSDEVQIPQDLLDERLRHIVEPDSARISLTGFTNFVHSVIEQRESARIQMSELLDNYSEGHPRAEASDDDRSRAALPQLTVRPRLIVLGQGEDQPAGTSSIDVG